MCTHCVHSVALFEKGYQQIALLMFYQMKFLIWFKENTIHLQHPPSFFGSKTWFNTVQFVT
uniref:Similarity n=1 Tax=Microcystis aeruginosa (strain PCC 7806) TaxID=267872 RepID=A8YI23_MICA7|nr:unnamed protein product [Microcystis aeruginosa PCC 7806]